MASSGRVRKEKVVSTFEGKPSLSDVPPSEVQAAAPRRLNFNVSEKAYNELNLLARTTHRSMTEIVRLGVGLAKITLEAEQQGGRLVIANSKGDPIKEIVLPS